MGFIRNLFGGPKLDGEALARSKELKEYSQIHLLSLFAEPRGLHDATEQQRWSRALAKPYRESIATFEKHGWLAKQDDGRWQMTAAAQSFVRLYVERQRATEVAARHEVKDALTGKLTGEALTARRQFEGQLPLGKADWTGPEPQLSHSALTRRIFFLDHAMLAGISQRTLEWLKLYAAEQHLWGAHWKLDAAEIPADIAAELTTPELNAVDNAYWKAFGMALYVDNQETWQRCKGGDHVRRLEIVGPDDEYTCDQCRPILGKKYLVARSPELPPNGCTSPLGCRCRYEPVLESMDEMELRNAQ